MNDSQTAHLLQRNSRTTHWLRAGWWIIATITVGMFIIALPARFAQLLAHYHRAEWIQARLNETEPRNLQHFGYGIKAFALSMIETALELTEGRLNGEDIQALITLAKEMLNAEVELLPCVHAVTTLSARYPLTVITKGDLLPGRWRRRGCTRSSTSAWNARGARPSARRTWTWLQAEYEFLAQYYARNGTPLRARLFAHIETLNRLGTACAPLSNWVANIAPTHWLFERLFGVHRNRQLPPFARETFPRWFAQCTQRRGAPSAAGDGTRSKVVLFHDTYTTYNYPELGRAAVKVLEAAGFEVVLADKKCC